MRSHLVGYVHGLNHQKPVDSNCGLSLLATELLPSVSLHCEILMDELQSVCIIPLIYDRNKQLSHCCLAPCICVDFFGFNLPQI